MSELIKTLPNGQWTLQKSIKPDTYNPKIHRDDRSYRNASDEHRQAHLKLFNNANPHLREPETPGESDYNTDAHNISFTHYMKTGRALKFDRHDDVLHHLRKPEKPHE